MPLGLDRFVKIITDLQITLDGVSAPYHPDGLAGICLGRQTILKIVQEPQIKFGRIISSPKVTAHMYCTVLKMP